MGIVSTSVGQSFVNEISSFTGTSFQKNCFKYLSKVIPDLRSAAELKKIDRCGIDIFQISEDRRFDYTYAFQCKGFEERFDISQYNQCLASLISLRKSAKKVDKYYMIVNLKSKYYDLDFKKKLHIEIDNLQKNEVVRSATFLDAESFLEFLARLIIEQLSEKIEGANARFASEYKESMNQSFYFEDIPFTVDDHFHINPSKYIEGKITEGTFKNINARNKKWFFIVSEFGFGKTSLLFNLFKPFNRLGLRCLYIPLSLFSKNDFLYISKFMNRILEVIEGTEINFNESSNKLFSKLLSYLFQYENNKIVLLLDGLDEQDELLNVENLKVFFKQITTFKCPILFALRKEMWDERFGNFQLAIGKSNASNKVNILLDEWDKGQIFLFIENFARFEKQLTAKGKKNIEEFKLLMRKNAYEELYGDIPKRPLFLQMLLSDIAINKIQQRTLSDIYTVYLKNKFFIDRGSKQSYGTKRPLSINEDTNKTMSLIFTILSRIANKMIIGVNKDNHIITSSYIEEKKIEDIIFEAGFPKTIELLLNSVLVSSGVRVDDNISLKFAHKSFQEFFSARAIFNHINYCLSKKESISDLNFIHSDGVNKFLLGFLKDELSVKKQENLKKEIEYNYNKCLKKSLADLITKM